MVLTESGFRSRAVSLLQSTSPFRVQTPQSTEPEDADSMHGVTSQTLSSINEKAQLDRNTGRDISVSVSSNEKTLTSSSDDAVAHDRAAQRLIRTIPTWVQSLEEEDEDEDPNSQLLPKPPPDAQIAQHNSSPASKNKHKHEPGRLYDADREWTPPTPRSNVMETASRWRAFADSSAYPPVPEESGQRVTEEWLIQNGPDYTQPWRAGVAEDDPENMGGILGTRAKRKVWWRRVLRVIVRSPLVPLVIRMIVWFFSLLALVLGGSIYRNKPTGSRTSPEMAIIVDAIALVYIIYITYDEYTGKPLGLRSAKAKMRLIFLDLFFIVFDSANLSLAFEALSQEDPGSQRDTGTGSCRSEDPICSQQKALASVLLIALIAWMLTFSISVLRLIEKLI